MRIKEIRTRVVRWRGKTVPPDGFEMLARDFDAIFVGALGDPRVPK